MATYNNIKKIKIGDNIFNLYDSGNSGGTITSVKTTAGAHTAINVTSGAVSFNVPTTAAHVGAATSSHAHGNITNGGDITATAPTIASGDQIVINDHSASKITNGPTFDGSTTTKALTPKGTWETFASSDKRLEITELTDNDSGVSYYPIVGRGNTAAIRQYDEAGFCYIPQEGTTANDGYATLILGNNITSGTVGNRQGELTLFDSTNYCGTLSTTFNHLTDIRHWYLPDKTGTIALVSDIAAISYPVTSVNSKTGAVSLTASDVGALPSTALHVSKITTSAGAHSTITNKSGVVSFNVPTKTSHLTNDSGFITTDTNTTYALSGALSSHTFTSTLTAGGSGSGTSTSALILAEGTGISLTDDTTNNTITVGHSNSVTAGTAGTSSATSGSTLAVPYVTYDAQGHITATGTHTHTVSGFVPTTRTVNGKALSANIADADYITAQGNKTASGITWNYRRTNSGDADAWATVSWSSVATSVWSSPVRYKDLKISIPSGIFSAAPRITATSTSTQYWVAGITVSSATSATIRFATVASSNFAFQAYIYAFGA